MELVDKSLATQSDPNHYIPSCNGLIRYSRYEYIAKLKTALAVFFLSLFALDDLCRCSTFGECHPK